jgi:amino acid transporter
VNYALASMILAAAEISNPDYVPETWHLYLVFLFLLVVQGFLAMNSTKILGYINIAGTIANLLVLVIFIIWLPAGSINRPRYVARIHDGCH